MNSPGREKSEALNGETRLTRQRTLLPHSQLDSSNGNATSERLTKILKSFAWKLLLSRGGKCSMAIFQGWIISLLCCNFLCTEMIEKYKKSWKFVQSILDKKRFDARYTWIIATTSNVFLERYSFVISNI